jgi:hypothetical protein
MSRLVLAVIALLVAAGCGLTGNDDSAVSQPTPGAEPIAAESVEPTPEETTVAPTTTPPTKKSKPTSTKATPTEDPNWHQAPACATHEGRKISKKTAKAALTEAAKRQYWRTEAPKLRVPFKLIKAVAWNESGWQSDIVNCDGGYGLMQTMPETVTHMNERFGLSYDPRNYRDNAFLGANYLAWLTKFFGDKYFKGSYDLSSTKCRSHSDRCLLNVVIAAYNAGFGDVDAGLAKRKLVKPAYVDTVRSLMSTCYCDRY